MTDSLTAKDFTNARQEAAKVKELLNKSGDKDKDCADALKEVHDFLSSQPNNQKELSALLTADLEANSSLPTLLLYEFGDSRHGGIHTDGNGDMHIQDIQAFCSDANQTVESKMLAQALLDRFATVSKGSDAVGLDPQHAFIDTSALQLFQRQFSTTKNNPDGSIGYYNDQGQISEIVSRTGQIQRFLYNGKDLLEISGTDATGAPLPTMINDGGVFHAIDPLTGKAVPHEIGTYSVDDNGTLTFVSQDGHTKTISQTNGSVLTETRNGSIWQITRVVNAAGVGLNFSYAEGRLSSVTDDKNQPLVDLSQVSSGSVSDDGVLHLTSQIPAKDGSPAKNIELQYLTDGSMLAVDSQGHPYQFTNAAGVKVSFDANGVSSISVPNMFNAHLAGSTWVGDDGKPILSGSPVFDSATRVLHLVTADGTTISLNPDGTTDSKPQTPTAPAGLSDDAIKAEADAIHKALNYDSWQGHFGSIDSKSIEADLSTMSELDRARLEQAYKEKYSIGLQDEFKWRFCDAGYQSEYEKVINLLTAKDGQTNDFGQVQAALILLKSDRNRGEQNLVDSLSLLNKAQIAQLESDYEHSSLYDGKTKLVDYLKSQLSDSAAQSAIDLYMQGTDGRFDPSTGRLSDAAFNTLVNSALTDQIAWQKSAKVDDQGNPLPDLTGARMAILEDAFRSSSPEQRKQFLANGGSSLLSQGFADTYLSEMTEYATNGSLSLKWLAGKDLHFMQIKGDQISQLFQHATDEERQLFSVGYKLANNEPLDPSLSLSDDYKKQALDFYHNLDDSLKNANGVYDWQRTGWEGQLLYKNNTLITDIANAHYDGLFRSALNSGNDVPKIWNAIDNMTEEEWNQLRAPNSTFIQDVDKVLDNMGVGGDERKRIDDLLKFKHDAATFADSQKTNSIIELFDQFQGIGVFGTDRRDSQKMIDGIIHLSPQEQDLYKNDANFRQKLDDYISKLDGGPQQDLARRMLQKLLASPAQTFTMDAVDKYLYDAQKNSPSSIALISDAENNADVRKYILSHDSEVQRFTHLKLNPGNFFSEESANFDDRAKQAINDLLNNGTRLPLDIQLSLCSSDTEKLQVVKSMTADERSLYLNSDSSNQAAAQFRDKINSFFNDDQKQLIASALKDGAVPTPPSVPQLTPEQIAALPPAQKAQYDQLVKAASAPPDTTIQLKPEDTVRAFALGMGSLNDVEALFGPGSQLTKDQKLAIENAYSAKYGSSLIHDVLAKVGDDQKRSIERILDPNQMTGRQELYGLQNDYLQSRSGFSDTLMTYFDVDSTRDLATRDLDQYRLAEESTTSKGKKYDDISSEQQTLLANNLASSIEAYRKSRDTVTETITDISAVALGMLLAVETGGLSLALLVESGVLTAGLKVAEKYALEGDDYAYENKLNDIVSGFASGGVNLIGGEAVAMLSGIGGSVADAVVGKLAGCLPEFLEADGEQALQTGIKNLVFDAVRGNSKDISEQAVAKLAEELFGNEGKEAATKLIYDSIKEQFRADARAGLQDVLKELSKGSLKGAFNEGGKFLAGEGMSAAISAASGAFGGAGSGLFQGAVAYDTTKDFATNLRNIWQHMQLGFTSGISGGLAFHFGFKGLGYAKMALNGGIELISNIPLKVEQPGQPPTVVDAGTAITLAAGAVVLDAATGLPPTSISPEAPQPTTQPSSSDSSSTTSSSDKTTANNNPAPADQPLQPGGGDLPLSQTGDLPVSSQADIALTAQVNDPQLRENIQKGLSKIPQKVQQLISKTTEIEQIENINDLDPAILDREAPGKGGKTFRQMLEDPNEGKAFYDPESNKIYLLPGATPDAITEEFWHATNKALKDFAGSPAMQRAWSHDTIRADVNESAYFNFENNPQGNQEAFQKAARVLQLMEAGDNLSAEDLQFVKNYPQSLEVVAERLYQGGMLEKAPWELLPNSPASETNPHPLIEGAFESASSGDNIPADAIGNPEALEPIPAAGMGDSLDPKVLAAIMGDQFPNAESFHQLVGDSSVGTLPAEFLNGGLTHDEALGQLDKLAEALRSLDCTLPSARKSGLGTTELDLPDFQIELGSETLTVHKIGVGEVAHVYKLTIDGKDFAFKIPNDPARTDVHGLYAEVGAYSYLSQFQLSDMTDFYAASPSSKGGWMMTEYVDQPTSKEGTPIKEVLADMGLRLGDDWSANRGPGGIVWDLGGIEPEGIANPMTLEEFKALLDTPEGKMIAGRRVSGISDPTELKEALLLLLDHPETAGQAARSAVRYLHDPADIYDVLNKAFDTPGGAGRAAFELDALAGTPEMTQLFYKGLANPESRIEIVKQIDHLPPEDRMAAFVEAFQYPEARPMAARAIPSLDLADRNTALQMAFQDPGAALVASKLYFADESDAIDSQTNSLRQYLSDHGLQLHTPEIDGQVTPAVQLGSTPSIEDDFDSWLNSLPGVTEQQEQGLPADFRPEMSSEDFSSALDWVLGDEYRRERVRDESSPALDVFKFPDWDANLQQISEHEFKGQWANGDVIWNSTDQSITFTDDVYGQVAKFDGVNRLIYAKGENAEYSISYGSDGLPSEIRLSDKEVNNSWSNLNLKKFTIDGHVVWQSESTNGNWSTWWSGDIQMKDGSIELLNSSGRPEMIIDPVHGITHQPSMAFDQFDTQEVPVVQPFSDMDDAARSHLLDLVDQIYAKSAPNEISIDEINKILESIPEQDRPLAAALLERSAANGSDVQLMARLKNIGDKLPSGFASPTDFATLSPDSVGNALNYLYKRATNNRWLNMRDIDAYQSAPGDLQTGARTLVVFDDLSTANLTPDKIAFLRTVPKLTIVDMNAFEKGVNVFDLAQGPDQVQAKLTGLMDEARAIQSANPTATPDEIAALVLDDSVDQIAQFIGPNAKVIRPDSAIPVRNLPTPEELAQMSPAERIVANMQVQRTSPAQIADWLMDKYPADIEKRVMAARMLAEGSKFFRISDMMQNAQLLHDALTARLAGENLNADDIKFVTDMDPGGSTHLISYLYRLANGIPSDQFISRNQYNALLGSPDAQNTMIGYLDDLIYSGTQVAQLIGERATEIPQLKKFIVAGLGAYRAGLIRTVGDPGIDFAQQLYGLHSSGKFLRVAPKVYEAFMANAWNDYRFDANNPNLNNDRYVHETVDPFFESLTPEEMLTVTNHGTNGEDMLGQGGWLNTAAANILPWMTPDNDRALITEFAERVLGIKK